MLTVTVKWGSKTAGEKRGKPSTLLWHIMPLCHLEGDAMSPNWVDETPTKYTAFLQRHSETLRFGTARKLHGVVANADADVGTERQSAHTR